MTQNTDDGDGSKARSKLDISNLDMLKSKDHLVGVIFRKQTIQFG